MFFLHVPVEPFFHIDIIYGHFIHIFVFWTVCKNEPPLPWCAALTRESKIVRANKYSHHWFIDQHKFAWLDRPWVRKLSDGDCSWTVQPPKISSAQLRCIRVTCNNNQKCQRGSEEKDRTLNHFGGPVSKELLPGVSTQLSLPAILLLLSTISWRYPLP